MHNNASAGLRYSLNIQGKPEAVLQQWERTGEGVATFAEDIERRILQHLAR